MFPETIFFWHWLALGLFLILIEVFVPGVLFLWLGLAGIVTGLLLLAVPDTGWELQIAAFAVLSVASIFLGRRFVAARLKPTDHPTLNRRAENFIGRTCKLNEATTGGRGRLRIGDTTWAFSVTPEGCDLEAGTVVTVHDVDGTTLIVRA